MYKYDDFEIYLMMIALLKYGPLYDSSHSDIASANDVYAQLFVITSAVIGVGIYFNATILRHISV